MAVRVPTTQELTDLAITLFESRLNQTIPDVAKAFIKVLAAVLATGFTSLYRFGIERAIQNLALTATGDDLDLIGIEYGVIRKPATAAQLEIRALGQNGTVVPITTYWVSDTTGIRYKVDQQVIVSGGKADMEVTARVTGPDANMSIGEGLTIETPIVNLKKVAEVITVLADGVSREDEEAYRRRVLNEIRTVGGGGNGVDYRTWAEEVPGVYRAFPYAGAPLDLGLTPQPGDRSVFVEATTEVDPDGIAPSWLLDDVRDNINTDPLTGQSRPGLGDTDATLWVESIYRTTFYNQVLGLTVDAAVEAQCKADIETALEQYYLLIAPYLEGIDPPVTKNSIITRLKLAEQVQDILDTYGGTAQQVNFGTTYGSYTFDEYELGQGEVAKSGGVVYV